MVNNVQVTINHQRHTTDLPLHQPALLPPTPPLPARTVQHVTVIPTLPSFATKDYPIISRIRLIEEAHPTPVRTRTEPPGHGSPLNSAPSRASTRAQDEGWEGREHGDNSYTYAAATRRPPEKGNYTANSQHRPFTSRSRQGQSHSRHFIDFFLLILFCLCAF